MGLPSDLLQAKTNFNGISVENSDFLLELRLYDQEKHIYSLIFSFLSGATLHSTVFEEQAFCFDLSYSYVHCQQMCEILVYGDFQRKNHLPHPTEHHQAKDSTSFESTTAMVEPHCKLASLSWSHQCYTRLKRQGILLYLHVQSSCFGLSFHQRKQKAVKNLGQSFHYFVRMSQLGLILLGVED